MEENVFLGRRRFWQAGAGLAAWAGSGASVTAAPVAGGSPPARGEFVIDGAHVLTMDARLGEFVGGQVHVKDGAIVAVGPRVDAPGARRIDAAGMICLPGLVDTHWHLWNCACRMFHQIDVPRNTYFPLTSRLGPHMTPADTYHSVCLGLAEGLASGITTVHNWSHNTRTPAHADAELSAMRDLGVRGRFSYGGPQGGPTDQPMDSKDLARVQREWIGPHNPLLSLGIVSRNLVAGQSLRGTIDYDMARRDWGAARALGLPITLHASPKGLVRRLEDEKLLGPDVQLVHPMFTTAEERAILKARGTSFSTSATAEAARPPDGGEIQLGELLRDGVLVSLSLDETVSGNADYFDMMRIAYKYHKHRLGETVPLTARRMLELATVDGARALGLDRQIGTLAPGKRADLILIGTGGLNIAPYLDPYDAILNRASPANVDTVIVDGRILRQRGRFTYADETAIVRAATASMQRLAPKA